MKSIHSIILFTIFTCLFFILTSVALAEENAHVIVKTEDGSIYIAWSSNGIWDQVEIQISDDGEKILEEHFSEPHGEYSFDNGEHGVLYHVNICGSSTTSNENYEYEKDVLFLKYDDMPDFPIIEINTYSGEDPTFDVADKPDEQLMGNTITNNEYVEGEVVFKNKTDTIEDEVKIRIRGNTSATGIIYPVQYPYKIKLEHKHSLLSTDAVCVKEWALLAHPREIKTYIGQWVASRCEMEWQLHMEFVNLILNGDYKGCYCLVPIVNIKSANGVIAEDGCIFENDPYYWNENGLYFKTKQQSYYFGYTFKDPKIDSLDSPIVKKVQTEMQAAEDSLDAGDEKHHDYIDEESWAAWLLATEIVGQSDGGGANQYFYKSNEVGKIKMGPLWDYDATLLTYDKHASCFYWDILDFKKLLKCPSFKAIYAELWQKVSVNICNDAVKMLDELEKKFATPLIESWKLENERFNIVRIDFEKFKERALLWFYVRPQFIDHELGLLTREENLLDVSSYEVINNKLTYYIDSTTDMQTYKEVAGWAFVKDSYKDYDEQTFNFGEETFTGVARYRIGILIDNKVYLAVEIPREDIKEAFQLEGDKAGFNVYIPLTAEPNVCIVDLGKR